MKTKYENDNNPYAIDFSQPDMPAGKVTCKITSARQHKSRPEIIEIFSIEESTLGTVYMSFPLNFAWAKTSLKKLMKAIEPTLSGSSVIPSAIDFLNSHKGAKFSAELTEASVSTMWNVRLATISEVTE